MEDSRRIQLSGGLSSIFCSCSGGSPSLSLSFPLLLFRITSSSSPRWPLKCCVFMQNPCLAHLSRPEVKIEVLVSAFSLQVCLTWMIPPTSPPPSPNPSTSSSPPAFTLLRKFLLPLPCLVVAPEKSELSQSSSLSRPQDKRAPSHMPRRLARSSAPLN